MYSLNSLYVGEIVEVIPTTSEKNKNKYQYEYTVSIAVEGFVQQKCRCVALDGYIGSFYDFEESVLDVGSRILVMFPNGIPNIGIIMGGLRKTNIPFKVEGKGPRYLKHFRETEQEISSKGIMSFRTLTKNTGPVAAEVSLTKETLELSSSKKSNKNFIMLDEKNDKITIKSGEMEITVTKDNNVNITGNAKVKVGGSVTIECGDATIKAKNLNANISGSAKIKVNQTATIDAQKINLAGQDGQVLTTTTQPTCYVTGVPFRGSSKVFAGS